MLNRWKSISALAALLLGVTLLGSGGSGLALAQQTAQSWSGWVGKVSDSTCGEKHKTADAQACTLQCVRAGAKYVLLVGEPAAHTYTLDGNASDFEKVAGALAKVQGDLTGTTLKASTVEAQR